MVIVREATIVDEARVFSLMRQLFALADDYDKVRDWDAAAAEYRNIVNDDKKGTILLAEEGGDIIGAVTLSYPEAIRCGGIYALIEEFIVSEQARGKGVGGKLLEAAIAQATIKGCDEIQVNRPSNLGYPVYLQHGLKDMGKHLKTKLPCHAKVE